MRKKALDNGMDYFDTARAYTDSEEKIGYALSARRGQFILATKTMSTDVEGFWNDLHTSLKKLNTDCIDVYQFHNPPRLTDELQAVIDRDKNELAGDFCRGCGYCLPCPVPPKLTFLTVPVCLCCCGATTRTIKHFCTNDAARLPCFPVYFKAQVKDISDLRLKIREYVIYSGTAYYSGN